MSAGNLSRWHAPDQVSTVLIAGDRGEAGEMAAMRLAERLERDGVEAILAFPPPPSGDWNEAARDRQKAEKEGHGRAP